jgi:predicted Fe-Mo cluster-binding NifX family protein
MDKEVRIAIPVDENEGLESKVSEHFGDAPFLFVCSVKKESIEDWKVLPNPGATATVHKGMEAGRLLMGEKVEVVAVVQLGEGAFWMLNGNGISVLQIPGESEEREGAGWFARKWRTLNDIRR